MEQSTSYKSDFQAMSVIHLGMIAGLLLFSGIIYFMGMAHNDDSLAEIFRYLVPGFAAIAILAGRFIGGKILAGVDPQSSLGEKLAVFRNASILRWAMVEGVGLFAVITYFLTGNQMLLIVALACAAYLFTLRPTPAKAAAELKLSEGEFRQISR